LFFPGIADLLIGSCCCFFFFFFFFFYSSRFSHIAAALPQGQWCASATSPAFTGLLWI